MDYDCVKFFEICFFLEFIKDIRNQVDNRIVVVGAQGTLLIYAAVGGLSKLDFLNEKILNIYVYVSE